MYVLPIPEEPKDRSVVLDCETKAWQRQGERWYQAGGAAGATRERGIGGSGSRTWTELLISKGPLAPMIAESAIGDYLAKYDPVSKDAPVAPAPLGCDSPSVTGEDPTVEQARPAVETAWGDSLGAELRGQGFGPDHHAPPLSSLIADAGEAIAVRATRAAFGYRPTVVRPVADRPQA